ncbi:MAG: DUF6531 domain-containing protein [Bdellovibrionota bacterium]
MMVKKIHNVLLPLLLVFCVMDSASANVSLKNGNFFMTYTDIVYPGGFEPKIERVYNSKTSFHGIFGWGWGTEYEAYLSVSADGSVVVHEYGGGADNRFNPEKFSSEELGKAADTIAESAQKAGVIGSADQLAKYKEKLRSDASFRNDEWEKLIHQGRVNGRQINDGARLQSNRFSYQYITKVSGGYVRTFDSGKIEKFNESGKLVRLSDKNNNYIEIVYRKDGLIEKILDNFNRKMFFTFNSQKLVEKIEGENGKKAEYKYNSLAELVSSRDVDGNMYTYKYDSKRRHNMVEIGYSDKTTMVTSYYDIDKKENVKSVKDRDGTLTEYIYDTDKSDRGHFTVATKMKDNSGKQISLSKYEYFIKYKQNGEEWTHKMISTLDGDRTETVYNELSGLPESIKHNGEETTFKYDPKGRVVRKATSNDVTELTYDQKASKVSKVVKYPINASDKQKIWSEFKYDQKGNLVYAKNSDKKGVKLVYDVNGRISTLVDQNNRVIKFKYNENSKPIEITDPSLGSITVTYNNSGEIKKVDSSAGRKIAVQVTSAFQNLLDIIRPAGVSLSF